MVEFFPEVRSVPYEGPDSKSPLAFKHYNPDEQILGRPMKDHLRFAVCYWHTFKNPVADPFGPGTRILPWEQPTDPMEAAETTMRAAFELFSKLGVPFWCFHDRDIAPEGNNLDEANRNLDRIVELARSLQDDTGLRPLWGTANLFSHPRYMSGAATNPDPEVFAHAAAQVKKAMDVTHALGGQGYVFWGGREGYETLLNTNMKRELDHLAKLLEMARDHKEKIGFDGQLYIEPKPREPTKHQYDFDTAASFAFLQRYGLAEDYKLNVEANHATLAGHTFQHELAYAAAHNMLGSVDANRGDLLLGWDTDQFPLDVYDTTMAMYTLVKAGGFTTGGLNFDAKVRRQSIEPVDLLHAHIGGMDAFARGLKTAAALLRDGRLDAFLQERYASWDRSLGQQIERGETDLDGLAAHAAAQGEPTPASGRQEMLENIINEYL